MLYIDEVTAAPRARRISQRNTYLMHYDADANRFSSHEEIEDILPPALVVAGMSLTKLIHHHDISATISLCTES